MVQRDSAARARIARNLGAHVREWRLLQGLSGAELARRAHVTRETLRGFENGTGNPRLDSVLAIMQVLGFASSVVDSADPLKTDAGRALIFSERKKR